MKLKPLNDRVVAKVEEPEIKIDEDNYIFLKEEDILATL